MSNADQLGGVLQRSNLESKTFKYFRLSSREINSGTPSNFTVVLGNDPALDRAVMIQPVACVFPNLANNVNSSNNALSVMINGNTYNVFIPPAYYSASALATAIEQVINPLVIGTILNVTVVGGLFVFTVSAGIVAVDAASSLAPYLGFIYLVAPAISITAPTLPNLVGATMLFIHSNTIASNATYLDSDNAGVRDVNGFLSVPITAAYGGQQAYEFTESQLIVLGGQEGRSVRSLSITLRVNGGRLYTELDSAQEFILVLKMFYKQ